MTSRYVGKNWFENLAWLTTWLENGPPVCFLQGFSGVGKTTLVNELINHADKSKRWDLSVPHVIADKATPSIKEELMELATLLSQYGFKQMEEVLFEHNSPNLAFALEKILRHPVIIVLDESQRWFKANSGSPLPELESILDFLRTRQRLPGRLLLVSDREVEEARWSEWTPIRKLAKPTKDEAIHLLELRVTESGVLLDISEARKLELVQDLDFNPRAIQALVSALRYASLDELIESNPSLWSVKDREVSAEFLRKLEEDILQRTIKHLDKNYQQKLQRLSVYRRGFDLKAIESVCDDKKEMAREVRKVLISHYFLNNNLKFLLLNPIVREISLVHLKTRPIEFKKSHAEAANYYARPFRSQKIIEGQKKLSLAFAELRYHLIQSENEIELKNISQKFTNHLRHDIKFNVSVPSDSEELSERIGVLSVLLELEESKDLAYHLARCLEARRKEGDIDKAITYAKKSLDNERASHWIFLANLLHSNSFSTEAIELLKQGIEKIPPDKNVVALYHRYADLLVNIDKVDEAVSLLKQGVEKIPPDKNVIALYHRYADLLVNIDKVDEAVSLLKQGVEKIPPDNAVAEVYQRCSRLLASTDKIDEAVHMLKDGITKIPSDKNVVALYHCCADLLADAGKFDEAIFLLKSGITKIPSDKNVVELYHRCANLLANAGKLDEALALLKDGVEKIPPDKNVVALYQLYSDLLADTGKVDEAVHLLKDGIAKIPPDKAVVALYYLCADLLDDKNETDSAISLLKEGVKKIPSDKGLFSIYQKLGSLAIKKNKYYEAMKFYIDAFHEITTKFEKLQFIELALYSSTSIDNGIQRILDELVNYDDCEPQKILGMALQDQLNEQWANAADRIQAARGSYSSYLAFSRVEAYSYLALGQIDKAWQILKELPNLKMEKEQPHVWLTAFIHLRRKNKDQAKVALEAYLGRVINEDKELNEDFLLKLWDGQITEVNSGFLCFYYPIIPVSLTGKYTSIKKLPFTEPVLVESRSSDQTKQLEIYVSYAWGEDGTENGKQREAIVDQLCQKLNSNGKQIGRDKDRIKSGDSIEEFANEIAKAKYVVAVISEKSLQSEWCMLYELYQAYKRCGERRAEFQKKIIALVMDDAKDLIGNSGKSIEQAKFWQTKHRELSENLKQINPDRKGSHHLWEKLDKMEEMYKKLPDMLDAIRDIAMKRGYEEILKNNFAEVIERVSK